MPRPQNVVFDIGRVLIEWHPRHLYEKMFADEPSLEAFLDTLKSYKLMQRLDQGEPFEICARDILRDHPEQEAQIRAYYERFDEMIPGPIDDSVQLLQELRDKGVPTFALSNFSHELFPGTRSRFASFMDGFKGIMISGAEKMAKPDPAFFRHMLKTYALNPKETVFIDDNQQNVETAEELGLIAFPFESGPKLRRDLETLDLL